MRLSEKQHKFSRMMVKLLSYIHKKGYEVSFEGFTRPNNKLKLPGTSKRMTYQELLKFNNRSKVTYGDHNKKIAGDLTIWKNGKILTPEQHRPIGEYWESIGGVWGGRFGIKRVDYAYKIGWDSGHFGLEG